MSRVRKNPARRSGSVVAATLASLRRNIDGEKFLSAIDSQKRDGFVKSLVDEVRAAFDKLGVASIFANSLNDNDVVPCNQLQSRGLIPEFPIPSEERIGFVAEDTPPNSASSPSIEMAVTCGVEDHLQMRAIAKGLNPEAAWNELDRLDSAINSKLCYAFRRDIGYLTANPALAGSALTFSAFVMPIGLEQTNRADETMKAMRRLGCSFAQAGSVPLDYSGLCKISYDCGGSRGERQSAIAFRRAIEELMDREKDARRELMEDGEDFLLDAFSRDLAIIKNAYAISADEAIAKLWTVFYGTDMGYIAGTTRQRLEFYISCMHSVSIIMTCVEDEQERWNLVASLYSADEEERLETEDYIDILRAERLRILFADAELAI